jgi:outer membrane protein insertion porin family
VSEVTLRTRGEQAAPNPQSEDKASFRKVLVEDDTPHRKVVIERIQFDGPIHLSEADVAQIIAETNRGELNADGSGWVEDLTEIGLRGAWQDRGYFHMKVTAEAHSLGGDSAEERFLVTAHVEEGLQYHLGDLRFVGAPGIPEAELREVFPLHGGELFSVSLVREGLSVLTKLYSSRGYIDFVAVPDTEVDDNLQRISLEMRLEEQKQFRVGDFEILGLAPTLEAQLRSLIRPGEIYDGGIVYDFYKENKWGMPSDLWPEDLETHRDVKAGIVDLLFDFRSCP